MKSKLDFYNKLADVKAEIGKISKDMENPFYDSKYFDINKLIDQLEPLLIANDLMLIQPIIDEKVVSRIIDLTTGDYEDSSLEIVNRVDPQRRGSEITFYRRYTLVSLLSLQAEDDDANLASGKSTKKELSDFTPTGKPKSWLNIEANGVLTPNWTNVLKGIEGGTISSVDDVREWYKVNKVVAKRLETELNR